MGKTVFIVETGVANIASIDAAFRRLGINSNVGINASDFMNADYAVIPGVGAFGAGMSQLARINLIDPIKLRIEAGRPTLAICLGLQFLASFSEETPGVKGLCIFQSAVKRFPNSLIVPHFGWNEILPNANSRFVSPGYAYFANSYHLEDLPPPWICSYCVYGSSFVAAVEFGCFLGCQFHPELSGAWGQRVLSRWIDSC